MPDKFKYIILLLVCLFTQQAFSQSVYPNQQSNQNQRLNLRDTSTNRKALTADQQLDTLRKRRERKHDTTVFNSKFIRVTNERLLHDSTILRPLDTGIYRFEDYSPLLQPAAQR